MGALLLPLADAQVDFGRAGMGTSLGFHIVFASLGMGMPLMMLLAEAAWLRTGDRAWYGLARKWAQAFGVLFAVGAVSGTVLSFQLGLLWPTFMGYAGGIIGLPFSLEGFAFFIEAIFLAIYLFGWERLSPKLHLLTGIPVVIAGSASAFFVVLANRWMNTPSGFRIENGKPVDVDPIAAAFGPGWEATTSHMIIAAFMATAFGIAAVYASGMLRGRRDVYHRKAIALALAVGAILAPIQIAVGDVLGADVAETQPAKLAAFEGRLQTEQGAGLDIGGIPIPGSDQTVLNVEVPNLLSLLAYGDPNATVVGLYSFPPDERPEVFRVRASFLTMAGIGTGLVVLCLWFWLYRRFKGAFPEDDWTLRALVAAGPLTFVAIEAGWFVTEFGRQPWIIYGILRTEDAVTGAPGLGVVFVGFLALYATLAASTIWLLRRLATGAPPPSAKQALP
ncbi:MAG: cytochrome ubiquinol oxidase subunit I [Thermoleophilaceae bacterium]|nr:cytochrome ubiquinol oxidase subunit I [Thermoleophilaceae bacterium]